jgi:hypothetical protein
MERVTVLRDSREHDDRRQFGWRTVVLGYARSRRRSHRRQTEVEPMFTDWHHPWLFFLATGTMLLSSVDAFFTLKLLSLGAVELNPIMAVVLGQSATMFAVTKMTLTGFGIMALVYLSRSKVFNRVRTGIFLTGFFSFYCCLVVYQFLLLIRIP